MEDAFSGKGAVVTSQVIVEITFARKTTMGCISYAYQPWSFEHLE